MNKFHESIFTISIAALFGGLAVWAGLTGEVVFAGVWTAIAIFNGLLAVIYSE